MENPTEKKVYTPPELVVHGSIEELTLQDKTLGPNDGFTFMGVVIRNAS